MTVTFFLALLMMLGMFTLLYAAVALIQNEKFFSSAPQEVQKVILPKKERFKGAHILGYLLAIIGIILMLGPILLGAIDGIENNFSFIQFFTRFILMLLLLKAFDIVFFDWYLLCHSNFFPHFYPETKELLGPHLFGFNKKNHIFQIIAFVIISIVLSLICLLF